MSPIKSDCHWSARLSFTLCYVHLSALIVDYPAPLQLHRISTGEYCYCTEKKLLKIDGYVLQIQGIEKILLVRN